MFRKRGVAPGKAAAASSVSSCVPTDSAGRKNVAPAALSSSCGHGGSKAMGSKSSGKGGPRGSEVRDAEGLVSEKVTVYAVGAAAPRAPPL